MTALAIQPVSFSFQESHDVRIQVIAGEPWFCLKDVCEVLDIKNVSQLSSQLDEKGICKTYTPTKGGKQQLVYVNEPNLYRVIFRSNKPEAKQFQDWVFNEVLPMIRKTGSYQQKPTSEPLSNSDMQNIKRLVWLMTGGMKFEQAWSNGVWYSLRAATGTPSPKPFTVDDLPALGEECRRIMKITTAVKHAMYEFEKDVIRKVVRKRGDLTPVIDQMAVKLAELQNKESDGLLMLETFDSVNIDNMVARR
jgi:prophage antirepressor-like protein